MLKIRVKTNQSKDEILEKDGDYIVNVKERPEKGRANLAVIKLFKKELKKNIRIVSGFKSREKLIEFI